MYKRVFWSHSDGTCVTIGGRLSITWKGLWSHTACLRALAHIVLQIMSPLIFSPRFHLFQPSLQPCYLNSVPPLLLWNEAQSVSRLARPPSGRFRENNELKINTRSEATFFHWQMINVYPGYIMLTLIRYWLQREDANPGRCAGSHTALGHGRSREVSFLLIVFRHRS